MLAEKKTLLAPLVPWLTGCSAVSPGHLPFWASASISVPGAPASSLVTGSQVLVSNPGVEICAPVCVAMALLCTAQPPDPRFVTSLASVSDGARTLAVLITAAVPWGKVDRPSAEAAAVSPRPTVSMSLPDQSVLAAPPGRRAATHAPGWRGDAGLERRCLGRPRQCASRPSVCSAGCGAVLAWLVLV